MLSSLRYISLLLFCFLTALFVTDAQGAEVSLKSLPVATLQKMDNARLLAYSRHCIEADTLHDEAIAALSLVVGRFYKDQTNPAIRQEASLAFQSLGNIYMTRRIDYRKAYKNTQMAYQIAREDNDHERLAATLNNKAALYNFNNLDDQERLQRINECLTQSIQEAIKANDRKSIFGTTLNIVVGSLSKNGSQAWKEYAPVINKIKTLCRAGKISDSEHLLNLINGADDLFSGRYAPAESIFLSMLEHSDYNDTQGRIRMSLEIILYNIYLKSGQYDKGIPRLLRAKDEAHRNGWRDYEYTLTGDLANLYELKGDKDSLDYYYNEYLRQRADLQDHNGFGTVQLLDAGTEIERINSDLEAISIKHNRERRLLILILCGAVLLAVIVVFLVILHRNLRHRNRLLFARIEQQAAREEQYRALTKNREKERVDLSGSIPAPITQTPPAVAAAAVSTEEKPDVEDAELSKYYAVILTFMEESRQIYTPGFSLSDLADAIHIPQRTVSRAINACHGVTFPKLLSEYRIREVIRLMHDRANDRYTIEIIAEMAGFQSRPSFSLLFKKTTGLSPSQYLKMMREENA